MKHNYSANMRKKTTKSLSTSGTNGEHKFTADKLTKALHDTYDLMQRVLLDAVYIAANDTARSIQEDRWLDIHKLEFYIEKRYITPEVISTLREWATPEIRENGFDYMFEGVPIHFRFIKRNYRFFRNPDVKIFQYGPFQIPNPFDNYWRSRHFIQ